MIKARKQATRTPGALCIAWLECQLQTAYRQLAHHCEPPHATSASKHRATHLVYVGAKPSQKEAQVAKGAILPLSPRIRDKCEFLGGWEFSVTNLSVKGP